MDISDLQILVENGLKHTGLSARQASLLAVGHDGLVRDIRKGITPSFSKACKLLGVLNMDLEVRNAAPSAIPSEMQWEPVSPQKQHLQNLSPTEKKPPETEITTALGLPAEVTTDEILAAIDKLKIPHLWSTAYLPDFHVLQRALQQADAGWPFNALQRAESLIGDESVVLDGDTLLKVAAAFRAIEMSPLCSEAYLDLAHLLHLEKVEKSQLVELAIESAELVLGYETIRAERGRLWSTPGARPYIKARALRAELFMDEMNWQSAANEYQEIIVLSGVDNIDCRYPLMRCLLELSDEDALLALFKQCKEDESAYMLYTRTLVEYRRSDKRTHSIAAQRLAKKAYKRNAFIPQILFEYDGFIYDIDAAYRAGDETEALAYSDQFGRYWAQTDGSIDWLLQALNITPSAEDSGRDRIVESMLTDTKALGNVHTERVRPVDVRELDTAAGAGAEVYDHRVTGRVWFRRDWLDQHGLNPKECDVIGVRGESMEPTLMDGSKILVNRASTRRRTGNVYVIRTSDGLLVKRLGRDRTKGWQLISDHPAWEPATYPDDAVIIGRVVWTARTLD